MSAYAGLPAPAQVRERATASRHELSVVIVTFNCRELALACLRSLAAERADVGLEAIVVDNASTDGALSAVRREFPWVRTVEVGGNVGFARATNLGLQRAEGTRVLLLNPDTLVPRGVLRACLNALEAHPDVGVLGCKLVLPDGRLDHACKRGFPTPQASLWYLLGLGRLRPRSRRFAAYTAGHVGPDEISDVGAINGAFMLVRREALEDIGGLDERFWMYAEDLDWCLRCWRSGWRVLYWPRAEVEHVKGGSVGKPRSWRTNYAFHHAMWAFYAKHYAGQRPFPVTALVWLGIWGRLAGSAVRGATRRHRGR